MNELLIKCQSVKVSKCQSVKVSKCQSVKVSKCQSVKVFQRVMDCRIVANQDDIWKKRLDNSELRTLAA